MDIQIHSYPEVQRLALQGADSLVLFSSYPNIDKFYPEIAGREIFRLAANGGIVWQITVQTGETDTVNGSYNPDIVSQFDFVYLRQDGSEYFAVRFNGDVFIIDEQTGMAHFHHWEKS